MAEDLDPPHFLKEHLKEAGRDQAWLAEKLRVTPATVSRYCKGTRALTDLDIRRIEDLLNLNAGELLRPPNGPQFMTREQFLAGLDADDQRQVTDLRNRLRRETAPRRRSSSR